MHMDGMAPRIPYAQQLLGQSMATNWLELAAVHTVCNAFKEVSLLPLNFAYLTGHFEAHIKRFISIESRLAKV